MPGAFFCAVILARKDDVDEDEGEVIYKQKQRQVEFRLIHCFVVVMKLKRTLSEQQKNYRQYINRQYRKRMCVYKWIPGRKMMRRIGDEFERTVNVLVFVSCGW